MYGFAHTDHEFGLFYLQNEIKRQSSSDTLVVWTKILSLTKLTEVYKAIDKYSGLEDKIARKLVNGYVPPLAKTGSLAQFGTSDKHLVDGLKIDATAYEEIADAGIITPELQELIEIDCAHNLYRKLSLVAGREPDDRASGWQHVPPESPWESLRALTCRAR